MTFDEALSAAVDGELVRAVDMAEGTYIDYNFDGWRINLHAGASSGYRFKEHDKGVAWEVYVKPKPVNVGWGDFEPPKLAEPAPKRRGRKAWVPPAEVNDIDDAKPVAAPKPNPWADAGIAAKPAATGWAIFK